MCIYQGQKGARTDRVAERGARVGDPRHEFLTALARAVAKTTPKKIHKTLRSFHNSTMRIQILAKY